MDHIGHYPPYRKLRARKIDVDGGQAGGLGDEPDLIKGLFEPPDQHFAIEGGDDHFAVGGFCRAVDDDDIAVGDAGADHGVAVYAHEEGVWSIYTEELFDFHNGCLKGRLTGGPEPREYFVWLY
jgi:hypothetical protein